MAIKYSERVIEHFKNPKNVGELKNANAHATEGSPSCGDQLSIYLQVNPKTNVIEDIKFESYGCASNIATASIITELAKGKTIEEAKNISWKKAADDLGGLPPVKMHCSVLSVDALRSAIKDYEEKHLGKQFNDSLNKGNIEKELNKIIYGKVGVDIITLKMVKYIGVRKKGRVVIDIELSEDDNFFAEMVDEINERLEKFPEIGDVEVNGVL